jgi:hypothetical protein
MYKIQLSCYLYCEVILVDPRNPYSIIVIMPRITEHVNIVFNEQDFKYKLAYNGYFFT